MNTIKPLIEKAKKATTVLQTIDFTVTKAILHDIADTLVENQDIIIKLNKQDLENGKAMRLSPIAMDRLILNEKRLNHISSMARTLALSKNRLSLQDEKKQLIIPPKLLAVVYESRPYISAEASIIAFCSGNAIILRGGKEGFHSNTAIVSILGDILEQNGLPRELITLIPTSDRVAMTELIGLKGMVDHVIPRGSEGLVTYIKKNSKIPVMDHLPEIYTLGV
jgi:glutamate-5-semialdehyde dehydrogenase